MSQGDGIGGQRWPTPEQVVSALDAAGHLLEQQVATELEGSGYKVRTNAAFTDPDEGKSRELDVYGYKEFLHDRERRLHVGIYLLVECKKTTAPYAFLTRPVTASRTPPNEIVITYHSREEFFEEQGRQLVRYVPTFDTLGLRDTYWGTANPVKAVHMSRLDRKGGDWNASNSGIFDSLTWPLAKAVRAFSRPFRNQNRGFERQSDYARLLVFVPTVVVASKLYTVDGTTDTPVAVEVDHVRFHRQFDAKDHRGEFEMDLVQRDALGAFIATIDTFGKHLAEIVERDPDSVIPPNRWPMASLW